MVPSISKITPVILTKQKDSKIALENLKKAKKKGGLERNFFKIQNLEKIRKYGKLYIYFKTTSGGKSKVGK